MPRSFLANRSARPGLLEPMGRRRDRTLLCLPFEGAAGGRLLAAPSSSHGATTRRLAALVLIAAGTLGLCHGKSAAAQDSHPARPGSIESTVNSIKSTIKESMPVDVTSWFGLAALATGGLFLFLPRGRG